ncbi:hypothetical protein GCM10022221_79280 [Actinocorallia aurea]
MPGDDLTGDAPYEELTRELISAGLTVRSRPEGGLIIRNLSSHSGGLGGRELPYLLRQEVVCAPDDSGTPWWFWVWTGIDQSAPPDLEPMCPAANVVLAAERIGRVLALPQVES